MKRTLKCINCDAVHELPEFGCGALVCRCGMRWYWPPVGGKTIDQQVAEVLFECRAEPVQVDRKKLIEAISSMLDGTQQWFTLANVMDFGLVPESWHDKELAMSSIMETVKASPGYPNDRYYIVERTSPLDQRYSVVQLVELVDGVATIITGSTCVKEHVERYKTLVEAANRGLSWRNKSPLL